MQSTREFRRFTGNFYVYGRVTLTATPAERFSFVSRVQWPCQEPELFERAVCGGVEAALAERGSQASLCVALVEVGWRERESAALAYQFAATEAMRDILHASTQFA